MKHVPTRIDLANMKESLSSLCTEIFGQEPTTIQPVQGGTFNHLFLLKFTERKILCRVYASENSAIIDRDRELHYITHINEQYPGRLAHVHCTFTNGMLYDFIEGRSTDATELPTLADKIAREMAQWHAMNVSPHLSQPDKQPMLFTLVRGWIDQAKQAEKTRNISPLLALETIEKEVSLLEQLVGHCEVGFCHNDLNAPNTLYNDETKEIHFIDVENCGYNYIAFDIGNHFCEYGGLEIRTELYPGEEQQKIFLKAYLGGNSDGDLNVLLAESNLFALMSHLAWGVWAFVQHCSSTIDFGFQEYSNTRLNWFQRTKDQVMARYILRS
jgi:thiamine kinase-like enzyme